jgi:diadenosine tetraphosphate (Ap4A) HIT family hydrolase
MELSQTNIFRSMDTLNDLDILNEANTQEIRKFFNNCRLCWALSPYGQKYISNFILYSTNNLVIIPALGSLLPGYLLLVSKRHELAMATLDKEELFSLELQIDSILKRFIALSNNWIIFEQGSTKADGLKGCCIEHMHLHFVPLKIDLANQLSNRLSAPLEPIDSLNGLKIICNEHPCNYIFIRNPDGKKFLLRPEGYPSQFVRQLIAANLKLEQSWDWKRFPMVTNSILTINNIQKANIFNSANQ